MALPGRAEHFANAIAQIEHQFSAHKGAAEEIAVLLHSHAGAVQIAGMQVGHATGIIICEGAPGNDGSRSVYVVPVEAAQIEFRVFTPGRGAQQLKVIGFRVSDAELVPGRIESEADGVKHGRTRDTASE